MQFLVLLNIHDSFCSKTALNLAKSRVKLLKNKREIQIKRMRRELAQLLQSGQDQTARIRCIRRVPVEHVAREEKMMVAYELIEIYCELIVARMPIIESQKNCPLDLKEAITSLMFAAQRCGDIPELQDISKNFTAKYGKDFATAAIELCPQCGVCRTLVEKLSVRAPDSQMKLKILNAIAEEHDVKWEPKEPEYEDPVLSIDMSKDPHGFLINLLGLLKVRFPWRVHNAPVGKKNVELNSASSSGNQEVRECGVAGLMQTSSCNCKCDDWDVKASCLSEFSHSKQRLHSKIRESDTILESSVLSMLAQAIETINRYWR
ncbi:hypothetical protein Cgig2_016717 [Carnegiea gigantea]|uniref:IST1 homolog n=1 Tax=Carnegiea gigantea TaxID=171969 RepID=A0A9Q1L0F3_9CARY|nr:hypothetical protein Cgig2_016717 [Carnegiea gigantea]